MLPSLIESVLRGAVRHRAAGDILIDRMNGEYESVAAQVLALTPAQTIDMADAAVTLSFSSGSGVQVTSSLLAVDPNSSGAGEDLNLPDTAEKPGAVLVVVNTGGENVVVKDNSGVTTIATVAAGEAAQFICASTGWKAL